jgi:hypothetical protein
MEPVACGPRRGRAWPARSPARLAPRRGPLGRSIDALRDPDPRRRSAGSGAPRAQPGAGDPAADDRDRRRSAHRDARGLGCRRGAASSGARDRTCRPLRRRAPHGRAQLLHPGAGARDRPGDHDLSRPVERLERHRLQRSRRSLRHRLRGPLRGDRRERRRRRASTPVRSASRCSASSRASSPPRTPSRPWSGRSRGGSISPTPTRSPPST